MIGATRSRIVLIFTFAVAVTIVVVLCTQIDLPTTWRQVKHVGLFGAFLLLIDMTLALMGPCVAWHILMRTEGINVGLGTTFRSALMGHAVNLISPLMYFGGEGVDALAPFLGGAAQCAAVLALQ